MDWNHESSRGAFRIEFLDRMINDAICALYGLMQDETRIIGDAVSARAGFHDSKERPFRQLLIQNPRTDARHQ